MSDEDPPDELTSSPPSRPPPDAHEPPETPASSGSSRFRERAQDAVRSRLESVIPEILKRAVEIGVEKARESPDNLKQFVHDLKLPKDIAQYLFHQIDETKNGLFRVVAKEIRDFLEHTNFAGEVQKLLTTVQFEVNTTIRFTPNDGRDPKKPRGSDDDDDGDDGASPDSEKGERPGRQPMPRPEVKTSVHVRRDGDDKNDASASARASAARRRAAR